MPLYRIHITSSDGAIDGPDEQGIELTGIGEARTRVVAVVVCDEIGRVLFRDRVAVKGPSPNAEIEGVWRAMAAMNP